jgi:rhodanese-related sulfurtransferase
MKRITYYIVFIIITATLWGCTRKDEMEKNTQTSSTIDKSDKKDNSTEIAGGTSPVAATDTIILEKISAQDAKEMMAASTDYILLDVRMEEEFQAGHIEGSILLPDYEVEEKAESVLTDKSTPILVYCRSGRRSAIAAQTLSSLGYTTVYDFGGILDWPYEVITE